LKIRIFTLAKELNMDSKILIGYCQKLGMTIKDSPLASVSEEERDRVLAFIKQGTGTGESAAKAEAVVPTRELVKPVGKVPVVRTLAPKAPLAREVRRDREVAEEAPEQISASAATAQTGSIAAGTAGRAGTDPALPASPGKSAGKGLGKIPGKISAAAKNVSSVDEAPASATDAARGPAEPTAPDSDTDNDADGGTDPGSAPFRREDYLPASGTMRTMTPRGNMTQIAPGALRRQKSRPTPQLPKLAEPPPAPKSPAGTPAVSAELLAQMPEMRLSRSCSMASRCTSISASTPKKRSEN